MSKEKEKLAVETLSLTKSYNGKAAVNHLSMQVRQGAIYGFIGRNGAGKSTTLKMLCGLAKPTEGEIRLFGKPAEDSYMARRLGCLIESTGLYPNMTARQNMMMKAKCMGLTDEKSVDRALASTGLSDTGSKKARYFSMGMKQRLGIGLALLGNPDLLILDEPLSGLDPVNTDLFKGIIRDEIAKGKYLIMSSHQMATVEEFCTDIIILNRSKTVLAGHLNDIKKSYGRINLLLKTETDVTDLIKQEGLTLVSAKETEYQIKVSGDEQANRFLKLLIENGVTVVTFSLREPSLHEIFVEKVGDAHEA